MIKCKNCQKELNADKSVKYCPWCGANIESSQYADPARGGQNASPHNTYQSTAKQSSDYDWEKIKKEADEKFRNTFNLEKIENFNLSEFLGQVFNKNNNDFWKKAKDKNLHILKIILNFLYSLYTRIVGAANSLYEKFPLDKINEKLGCNLNVKSKKSKMIRRIVFAAIIVFIVMIPICLIWGICALSSNLSRETCLWCGGAGIINGTKEVRCDNCNGKGTVGKCHSCNGSGTTFIFNYRMMCASCLGGGKQFCRKCYKGIKNVPAKLECGVCDGRKKVKPEINVRVKQYCKSQIMFMNMMMNNTNFSSGSSSFPASSSNYGTPDRNKSWTRRCSIHGVTYDIRFGSGCAWCRQPDFGSGKTTTAKCPRHNYYYDPSVGCPICN